MMMPGAMQAPGSIRVPQQAYAQPVAAAPWMGGAPMGAQPRVMMPTAAPTQVYAAPPAPPQYGAPTGMQFAPPQNQQLHGAPVEPLRRQQMPGAGCMLRGTPVDPRGVMSQPAGTTTINTTPAAMHGPRQISGQVRLVGLEGRSSHNGKLGWVMPPGVPDASGNVKVQIEGEAAIADLPMSYLEQMGGGVAPPSMAMPGPPVAAQDTSIPDCNLRIGERVKMRKVAVRPQYEGRTGVVESMDARARTVLVQWDQMGHDGIGQLTCNPAHLQSLDDPDASPGGFSAQQLNQIGFGGYGAQIAGSPQIQPQIHPQLGFALPQGAAVRQNDVSQVDYPPGSRARVAKTMMARPHLIGKTCTVESTSPGGELMIRFDDPALAATMLNLKPQHLEPC